MHWYRSFMVVLCLLLPAAWAVAQPLTINTVGGFEGGLPSYWNMGNAPGGSALSWATDQFHSMGHSLKITKSTTADSASWISDNMCDIWSPRHYANVDIFVGAYVKTEGVNTSPANDDEKWWISYSFYDSAGALIGETKLPIDQSVATSTGWIADTNGIGETLLPIDSWKTIIRFVGGKNATGTVWAGDFMLYGRNGWAGQDWNAGVGMPTGWNYWLPPNGGNDGLLNDGFENTIVTNEAAHTGLYSLKFNMPFDRVPHDGWVGTKRYPLTQLAGSVKAGDVLRVSMWLKAENLVPDSAALYPGTWSVGVTPIFHSGNLSNDSYDEIGAHDYTFTFPNVTSFDWTEYYVDVTVPAGTNVKAISVRPHVYSRFTGTVYYDDITVTKLDIPEISGIGSFESPLPSYWNMGNAPGGSALSWATDQFHSMGHSLKITKSTTADSASWISDNMCDIWSPRHYANVDIFVGAYVKTEGVNTSPANDDEKWWISYSFYDSAGALIGETKLPIDQSVATSTGWIADTNGIGETLLPIDSWKTIIRFVGGKNATGTVWAGDFMLYGRNGWAGQDWNAGVGMPTGWNYWLPPNGGNDGLLNDGFENTIVTNEAAHTGLYSLKFNMPFDRVPHDGWVGTKRYPLNPVSGAAAPKMGNKAMDLSALSDIKAGDVLRVSMWLKAENLVPDSAALYPGTWSVGVTPIFHSGWLPNDSYDEIGAHDYTFTFPNVTAFDWTQYYVDVTVPAGTNVNAISVRPHVYSRFTGTVYYDDITVTKLDIPEISGIGSFESPLPSYWNMGNAPGGSALSWATDQFHSMGHSLKITKSTTADSASWISDNMCDIWSPRHYANVDIFVGAYVKTEGVNTSPANDDEKWWISYSFYDSAGALIGETKLPIDQSVATSTGWIADTNGIGETLLPIDSWKTIIRFVGGKNATGTVWAGDFMLYGRNGWAGQDWNAGVGMPTGWNYWLPPNGGNDGLLNDGFENTIVTNEAAHTGLYSLKFNMPFDRVPHDGWVGTKRYPLNSGTGSGVSGSKIPMDLTRLSGIKAGDILRVSMWLKAENLVPDSAALYPGTWSVGVTPIFHSGYLPNDNYDEIGAHDYTFAFPAVTSFGWTQYYVDVTVPDDPNVKAISIRPHVYSRFTGTVYYDDIMVQVIGTSTGVKGAGKLPVDYALADNYPNPFNPTTTIRFATPKSGAVSLVIYNLLGEQVRTLVEGTMDAGDHVSVWDGRDDHGQLVQSGVYFCQMRAGTASIVKKMMLVK